MTRKEVEETIKKGFALSGQVYDETEFIKADYSDKSKLLSKKDNPRALYRIVLSDYYRSKGYFDFNLWYLRTKRIVKSL